MKTILLAVVCALALSGCATQPQLTDYMQTRDPVPPTTPTKLTDWGIVRFGEDTIVRWGGQSQLASVLSTGGAISLATLSTAALAMSGNPQVNQNITTGVVAGGNWLLQMMGIIRPAERNDYRIRGQQDIVSCRGEFYKALSATGIGVVSTRRFTGPGSIYLDCIGGAQMMVEKQINGIRINNEDLKRVEPVPIEKQPTPPADIVKDINAEAGAHASTP